MDLERQALERLKEVATSGGNLFAELMETVKVASLGQISDAFFEVGGRTPPAPATSSARQAGTMGAGG